MDKISTGIKGFDDIMGGLYPGDNVVWQVEDINNYKHVVDAFVRKSIKDGKNVNYIHFRKVNSIIDDLSKVNLFELDLAKGFEDFTLSPKIISSISFTIDSLSYGFKESFS